MGARKSKIGCRMAGASTSHQHASKICTLEAKSCLACKFAASQLGRDRLNALSASTMPLATRAVRTVRHVKYVCLPEILSLAAASAEAKTFMSDRRSVALNLWPTFQIHELRRHSCHCAGTAITLRLLHVQVDNMRGSCFEKINVDTDAGRYQNMSKLEVLKPKKKMRDKMSSNKLHF